MVKKIAGIDDELNNALTKEKEVVLESKLN